MRQRNTRQDTIGVSELSRQTREVIARLAREPHAQLVVLRNNRAVAVISGTARGGDPQQGSAAGAAMTREQIVGKRDLIRTLARAHGARELRLFGSVARGTDRPGSDIDFLVELDAGRTLLDLIGLENDLSAALGRKVDVVATASAKPRVLKTALRDAIRLV